MNAQKRLKRFYEKALFKQDPFKYISSIRPADENGFDTKYLIYNDSDMIIYRATFYLDINSRGKYWVDFGFETYTGGISITNTNRDIVFRLFSTIINILKEYFELNKSKFDYLTFSADNSEPSRVRLYNTLFEKFKKEYEHSYYFEKRLRSSNYAGNSDDHQYYITKKASNYNPITRLPREP